jgi:protein ImuA
MAGPDAVAARGAAVAALREAMARVAVDAGRKGGRSLSLGAPDLDRRLGGGLALAACHDCIGADAANPAALSGFGMAIGALLLARGVASRLFWVLEPRAAFDLGRPYAPGLLAFGIDPARVVVVFARDRLQALGAAEEILREGSAGAVLELFGEGRGLDGRSARRLALAAAEGGGLGLLLRHGGGSPLPLPTRFAVAPTPSPAAPGNTPGPPAFALSILRNRLGPLGRFRLVFDPQRPTSGFDALDPSGQDSFAQESFAQDSFAHDPSAPARQETEHDGADRHASPLVAFAGGAVPRPAFSEAARGARLAAARPHALRREAG